MYEQNAVVVNEFLGDSWSHVKILELVSSKFNHF